MVSVANRVACSIVRGGLVDNEVRSSRSLHSLFSVLRDINESLVLGPPRHKAKTDFSKINNLERARVYVDTLILLPINFIANPCKQTSPTTLHVTIISST